MTAAFFMYQIAALSTALLGLLAIFNARIKGRLETYGQDTLTFCGIYLIILSILNDLTSLKAITPASMRNAGAFFAILTILGMVVSLMFKVTKTEYKND